MYGAVHHLIYGSRFLVKISPQCTYGRVKRAAGVEFGSRNQNPSDRIMLAVGTTDLLSTSVHRASFPALMHGAGERACGE